MGPRSHGMPMLADPDSKQGLTRDQDRLRLAAVNEEQRPMKARLEEASALLLRLRGLLAHTGAVVPADLDQELFAWLHAGAVTRKAEDR